MRGDSPPGGDVAVDVTLGLQVNHGRGHLVYVLEEEEFGDSRTFTQEIATQLAGVTGV